MLQFLFGGRLSFLVALGMTYMVQRGPLSVRTVPTHLAQTWKVASDERFALIFLPLIYSLTSLLPKTIKTTTKTKNPKTPNLMNSWHITGSQKPVEWLTTGIQFYFRKEVQEASWGYIWGSLRSFLCIRSLKNFVGKKIYKDLRSPLQSQILSVGMCSEWLAQGAFLLRKTGKSSAVHWLRAPAAVWQLPFLHKLRTMHKRKKLAADVCMRVVQSKTGSKSS